MKNIKFIIYKEGEQYVSQCLNVEVSSFGSTIDEARKNIHEAVELYMEDNKNVHFTDIDIALLGEDRINV